MATAVITRVKQYATPGSNAMFAWRWVYSVQIDSAKPVSVGTRLGEAVAWAKERAATITRAWESK